MAPSTIQISAPGLTEEQLRNEQAWLDEFNQAADSLDWSRWERFWGDGKPYLKGFFELPRAETGRTRDAFLQFGNTPKIIGKSAITSYFEGQLGALDLMHHA